MDMRCLRISEENIRISEFGKTRLSLWLKKKEKYTR